MSAYDLILQGTFSANSSTYFNEAYDIKERDISKQLYVETVLKEHFLDDNTFSNYTAAPEIQPLLAHVSYMLELNKWKEHCKSQVVEPVKRPVKSHTSRSLVASTITKPPAPVAPKPTGTSNVSSTGRSGTSSVSSTTASATSSKQVNITEVSDTFPLQNKSSQKWVDFVFIDIDETNDTLVRNKSAIVTDDNGNEKVIKANCVDRILDKQPINATCGVPLAEWKTMKRIIQK